MPVYFEGKRKKVRYGKDLVEVRFGKKTKKEAFAVFSADDGSLNFYKRVDVPKVGERFEGKTVTEVYVNIEDTSTVPWSAITNNVESVDVVDIICPISTRAWFNDCIRCKTINVKNLKTDEVTDMDSMFFNSGVISLDLSGFNTSNVTSMNNMFAWCINLRQLDVSNFDTRNVFDMTCMFDTCRDLKTINLSSFDTSNVELAEAMFADCKSLTDLNISNFNTDKMWLFNSMFSGCDRLKTLNIANFNNSLSWNKGGWSDVFTDCSNLREVIVSDRLDFFNHLDSLPVPDPTYIPNADGKWYAASDGKGYAPEDIPSNKADTYYAYPPTETYKDLIRTGVPAMGTSSDVFVSPSKRTKYRATLDTTSSASGRGMSVYIYNANSGSMINSVQLSITGARTQYFELNQGNYKINAFFDCHNGYPSTFILQEVTGFNFAKTIEQGGVK